MLTIEAKVLDPTHLKLSHPIGAPVDTQVMISIFGSDERGKERDSWLALSGEKLRTSYGNAEPEYEACLVRESNPEYTHE